MSKQNLATVTHELIASYGNTAKNVITACRVGNQRAVRYVDQSWETAVSKTGARLNAGLRGNAIAAQKKVSALYVKGVEATTANADLAVSKAVEIAGKGVEQVAANASRFEKTTGVTALSTLAVATLPAAQVVVKAAATLEAQSGALVKKIAGSPVKAKVKPTAKVAKVAKVAKRAVVKKATAVAKTTAKTVRKATAAVAA